MLAWLVFCRLRQPSSCWELMVTVILLILSLTYNIQLKQTYIKLTQLYITTQQHPPPPPIVIVPTLTIPPIPMKVIQAEHSAGRGPVLLLKVFQERNGRQ